MSLAGKGIAFLKICSVLELVLLSRHILNKEHVGIHSEQGILSLIDVPVVRGTHCGLGLLSRPAPCGEEAVLDSDQQGNRAEQLLNPVSREDFMLNKC